MSELDTQVRDRLHHHLSEVQPPGVDVGGLVARGRRARHRRTAASVAAGLAGVAAAVSLALVLPSSPDGADTGVHHGTQTLPVATGGARGPVTVPGPTGVFVTKGSVYMDGKKYDVDAPWGTGAHISAQGLAYPDADTGRPMLLRLDGKNVPLAPARPELEGASYSGWVAADSDSGLVAWAEQTKESADIVVYDAASMTEVDRKRLSCEVQEMASGCPVPYVVSSGVVFVLVDGGSFALDVSTGEATDTAPGVPAQAHNKVLAGFEDEHVGVVDALPGWAQATVPEGVEEGILSYDGSWFLDNNGDPEVVSWRDPSQTIRYAVPGDVVAAVFDTDGSVLSVSHDADGWSGWDCPVDGPCERVVGPQAGEIRLVAWDL